MMNEIWSGRGHRQQDFFFARNQGRASSLH